MPFLGTLLGSITLGAMSKGNSFVQEALIPHTSLAMYQAFLSGLCGDSLRLAATAEPENTVTDPLGRPGQHGPYTSAQPAPV